MRELREAVREADAVLIATPEYNHSIPGAVEERPDWASRPAGQSALGGKPAAAIGASTGMFGAVWAQAEPRKVLGALGGRVIEAELPVARARPLRVDGRLELALSSRSSWRSSSPGWSPPPRRPTNSPASGSRRNPRPPAMHLSSHRWTMHRSSLGSDALHRRDPVDPLVERGDRRDAGQLRPRHEIGLGEVEALELIDLEGPKEELGVS